MPPGAFLAFYPAVRTGSSNTHFFPVVFYPAVRTGSSNTLFFPCFFFWWSLAPELRFSLGQRNTRRVFRYTGKGFYLEWPYIFYTPLPPGGEEQRRGLMPLELFFFFLGGHLPQTSAFRLAKQILVVSFATQARAFILSDHNIFYTPGGGENNGGV